MKKLCVLCFALLFFSGCSKAEPEELCGTDHDKFNSLIIETNNSGLSCTELTVGYGESRESIVIDDVINKSIIDLMDNVDTTDSVEVDTAFLGYYTIRFNDDSVLYVDDNEDLLALYCKDAVNTIVKIPEEFKNYLEEFNK